MSARAKRGMRCESADKLLARRPARFFVFVIRSQ